MLGISAIGLRLNFPRALISTKFAYFWMDTRYMDSEERTVHGAHPLANHHIICNRRSNVDSINPMLDPI